MLADPNQSEKKVTFEDNKFGLEDKQQSYLQAIKNMPQIDDLTISAETTNRNYNEKNQDNLYKYTLSPKTQEYLQFQYQGGAVSSVKYDDYT